MTASQLLEQPARVGSAGHSPASAGERQDSRVGSAGQGPASAGHQESGASAARTSPVHVHLTPFAPGCEKLGMASPRRNATFYGKTLSQVLRATLKRCQLPPGAARIETEDGGDINLLGPVPPELAGLQSSEPGVPVPFAIIWAGAEAPALVQTLEALRASGWTPASGREPAGLRAPATEESPFPKPEFDPGSYS